MLELPTVTLLMVATRDHGAAQHAFQKAHANIDFRNKVVASDNPPAIRDAFSNYTCAGELASLLHDVDIELTPFKNYRDVCPFALTRLPSLVLPLMGSHVLSIQWDGFPVHPAAWTDEFLEYDYVGAPLFEQTVGNNGFCLQSRRYFEALQDLDLPNTVEACHPSDQKICFEYRDRMEALGVKFAPVELARRFSVENQDSPIESHVFGGHGKVFVAHEVRIGRY